MKFFTLAMLAACTMTAYAQSPYSQLADENDPYLKSRQVLNVGKVSTKNVKAPQGMAKAPAEEGLTAIFDQPEGELQLMRREGTDWLPVWGSPAPAYNAEKGTYVVKGTDGNYYFKNFISNMCNGGAWVKGTVEGDVISVATGQICTQLWWFNGEEDKLFTYYLYALDFTTHTEIDPYYGQEYEVKDYFPDFTVESIQFKINSDGSLTNLSEGVLFGGVEYIEEDQEYSWPGQGDQDCNFYPFYEVPQVAPEGIEYTEYLMKYLVYNTDSYRYVDAAVADGKIYIAGLSDILPSGIVIADIQGDKAVVNTDQFMGLEQTYSTLVYLKTAASRVETDEWGWSTIYFDPAESLTMTFDAASQNFAATDAAMLINAGKNQVSHHEQYDRPQFTVWNEVPAVPALPEWTYLMPYTVFDWGAWGYASFNLYTLDADGNYILPEKLSYICYLDDAPFVFTNAETLEEMTEIPYYYSDNDVIGGGTQYHTIYFYVNDFEHFGVQTVYYGGSERNCSAIVYDDGTIVEDQPVGIGSASAQIAGTQILDAAGNHRSQLGQGLNIVTVTYADGSKKTAKLMIK